MTIPRKVVPAGKAARRRWQSALRTLAIAAVGIAGSLHAAEEAPATAGPVLKQYCFGCHGNAAAMGGVNLEKLTAQPAAGEHFAQWQKVVSVLEQKRMPPPKMRQPSDTERASTVSWVRSQLNEYAQKHAGDPGRVTIRRLTSGEYAYTIRDLTGLDLKFDRDFASDSVGGEGFTNFGDVQFMADANLERYLEAAKNVADHAVIGAGPLVFHDDPGKTGFELSAITRINDIYRANGFRANSGEGGKPFGLERYTQALFACWQYQNRQKLNEPNTTLDEFAKREGASLRLAQHLWSVVHQPSPAYPTSEVVSKWQAMPVPAGNDKAALAKGRASADALMRAVVEWPRFLFAAGAVAEGGEGDERALVLNDANLKAEGSHKFKFVLRARNKKATKAYLALVPVNPAAKEAPVVLWKNATVRIRQKEKAFGPPQPLRDLLDQAAIQRIGFGRLPNGTEIDPQTFAMPGEGIVEVDLKLPDDTIGAELTVEAVIADDRAGDDVLRCTVSDSAEVSKGRPVWALLGNSTSAGYRAWKKNVLEYADILPQNSQGEPAPSDKDPIPLPFDNTYNQPERDHFHAKLKYFRDDRFLVEHVLDDTTRVKLDQAWTDLIGSFDYHDTFLRFVSDKYKLNLQKKIAALSAAEIESLPAEPRQCVKALRAQYDEMQKAMLAAHPRHVNDCLEFAAKAWRRPLSQTEQDRLRAFYVNATETGKLDHGKAIEATLARVLVSPAFLYRLEQPAEAAGVKALTDWEMASRLSYFLWSSLPDAELRRAAAAGELSQPDQLERQVKRMLADAKSRRMATEFFGQWLGFYRFDQHRGVDTKRFPEFTDEVKAAMYDESISFFEHIIRKDRPVREILSANYTFLNQALAKHYGINKPVKSIREVELVENVDEFGRGGLLRLGSVLTATSAPLRTSPVKRGDWVLRRILGTPTPPPPADAGSIPADDKAFGGMSVKERLAVHQRNATCASCHSRIDPLGFPLEKYDSVGRVRSTYADGKPVQDSSTTSDQTNINGVDGLLQYLKAQDQQVLRTMSHKLLGYALGRTVLASDQPLVDRLTSSGSDAPFSRMVAEIVASKQFRYRRERVDVPPATTQRTSLAPVAKQTTKEGGL